VCAGREQRLAFAPVRIALGELAGGTACRVLLSRIDSSLKIPDCRSPNQQRIAEVATVGQVDLGFAHLVADAQLHLHHWPLGDIRPTLRIRIVVGVDGLFFCGS